VIKRWTKEEWVVSHIIFVSSEIDTLFLKIKNSACRSIAVKKIAKKFEKVNEKQALLAGVITNQFNKYGLSEPLGLGLSCLI
jgi:hypothetical protein